MGRAKKEPCPYCRGTGKLVPSPAARFKALREREKMGQKEFAESIGVSRAQVANIEAGRTSFSVEVMMRTADRYGVSVDWLLGRD